MTQTKRIAKELELIKKCTPEDRDVMIDSLQKMNKAHNKAVMLMIFGVVIFLGGLFIIVKFESPFGIVGLFIGFLMIITGGVFHLKNAVLV